jgi:hypothetical protein
MSHINILCFSEVAHLYNFKHFGQQNHVVQYLYSNKTVVDFPFHPFYF